MDADQSVVSGLAVIFYAFAASLILWAMTAAGAGLVFFTQQVSQRLLDILLGFSGGVMLAVGSWSLLQPAIEMSSDYGALRWLPATAGFGLGVVLLHIADLLVPRLQLPAPDLPAKGMATSWRRTTLLLLAVTLHNIPEGLVVGAIFAAVAEGAGHLSMAEAVALMAGMSLHKLPEGLAIALPLRREGLSPQRSFWYGQATASLVPLAAIVGAVAATSSRLILPYFMGFAASAMTYVVVREVIPETQSSGHAVAASASFMLGFLLMMVLDILL